MRTIIAILAVLSTLGAGFAGWYYYYGSHSAPVYRTAAVERGNLLATISATGTIQPEEGIDVGSQVAGMIKEFGRDPRDPSNTARFVDYGTPVEPETVLALIDDSLYKADVASAQAQLNQNISRVEQAKANVKKAEADLEQNRAKAEQTRLDYERSERLRPSGTLAQADFEVSKAGYETARAAVVSSEAALALAKAAVPDAEAAVALARAMLDRAKTNLGYTVIKSPVKGIVVDRRVNIGQTVVSSLTAPSLFLLAKDITRLQVWASVNEADIGQIQTGQNVRFTVDAHPHESFTGTVAQIRLNATMTQNVVTYTVVVITDNSSGKLLPYLTANLQFETGRRDNVLLVPNAALRWQPQVDQVAPDAPEAFIKSQRRKEPAVPSEKAATAEREKHDRGLVWIQDGEFARPIKVRVGYSDGFMTEVAGEGLEEGMNVIVREGRANETGSTTTNPFTPQMFGGKKQQ
jgi:HlyD family secretion protein